jgi:hypothetical protein
MRRCITLSCFGAAVLAMSLLAPMARGADPAYVSIMISRSTSQEATPGCVPYAGTVPIASVASGLKQHGMSTVVGSLVVDWAAQADSGQCVPWFDSDGVRRGQTTAAGWQQAATLRDKYGWKFVSHSKTYVDLTTVTDAARREAETCGTLDAFRAHGHPDANALFNYPDNLIDAATQSVVATCFSYGRRYGSGVNTQASTSLFPHEVYARSVTGGRCNNPKLACYSMPVVKNRRYSLPASVATTLRPAAGRYAIVQFYRFVTGKRAAATGPKWDCTSRDARDHYTTATETYCLNDLYAAVDGRSSTAIVTHPAAVAAAWGRVL